MADQEKTITLNWYCGYFVGPAKWQHLGDWVLEPDECCTEFTTEVTQEEWDDGAIYATCPSCGAELTLEDDHPEPVGEVADPRWMKEFPQLARRLRGSKS